MQQKSGKISRAFTNQYQARAQLGAQWPTIHAWLARTENLTHPQFTQPRPIFAFFDLLEREIM